MVLCFRVPSYSYATNQAANVLYKKRAYEEKPAAAGAEGATTAATASSHANREAGVPQKLQRTDGRQHIPNVVPPKGRVATLTRISGGQRHVNKVSTSIHLIIAQRDGALGSLPAAA